MRVWLLLAALVFVPAASAFDSADLAPGDAWSMTFPTARETPFAYHCHPHPWMMGHVLVTPDSDGVTRTHAVAIIEPADSAAWGYSPPALVIEAGDTVTWTNQGSVVHTVTEEVTGAMHDGAMGDDGMPDGAMHDDGMDHGDGAMDGASADDGQATPLPIALVLVALLVALLRRR